MRLNLKALGAALFISLAGGVLVAASAWAGAMPETFTFAFGTEYTLEKVADLVTITHRPAWSDAQRPPGASLDAAQEHTVRISPAEAQALWARIAALDPSAYQQPTDGDFEPAPPDMRHTESLTWVVTGKTVAAWSHGYRFLKAELRRPLALTADAIRSAYQKAAAK